MDRPFFRAIALEWTIIFHAASSAERRSAMSRHVHTTRLPETVDLAGVSLPPGEYEVAAGFDHACGWFVQIYDPASAEDELLLDRDTLFHRLNWDGLATILQRLNWTPRQIQQVQSQR
jgi:hypothetical protein